MKSNQHLDLNDLLAITAILGYTNHFSTCPDGTILCFSEPKIKYALEDLNVKPVCLKELGLEVSLYLISSKDGCHQGTMVEYWCDTF